MRLTMQDYDEMKSYVGFDDDDAARLRQFAVVAEPHVAPIIDHFYERIEAFPAASAVLTGDAQVQRLKSTLRVWLRELLGGPHDLAYFDRRERIGRVHVQVSLHSRFMFTAMAVIREDLIEVARNELSADEAWKVAISLQKVTELDLAIMTGTYISTREERQMVALQELIVAHMPVAILLFDDHGVITAATKPGVRLLGSAAIGRSWRDALPAALIEAAGFDAAVERATRSGQVVALPRVDVTLDAGTHSFAISFVPLDTPQARLLVHLEDLTEAVRAEARLRRAESLAQLGALSAAVAHELRNPLAGISGALQVISRSLDESDHRRTVMQKVNEQIIRLDALVTDLLSFARPAQVQLVDADLWQIAHTVCDLVCDEYPNLNLQIEGAGRGQVDARLVQQILLNLLQNAAVEVQGTGDVLVTITDHCIVVSDSGKGIAKEHGQRIFEPFFTTRTRGTGLGLAICRKSAQEMGGSLELTQGPLLGASFTLTLQAAA